MPTGTPTQVITRLVEEIARISKAPDWQAALLRQGISAMPRGPAELAIFLNSETERWSAAVRAFGATAD
ncbi:hypothetical protein E2C06_34320 [Dankookia rubra]|uniref:Tripartite tricarboxylate transporter substrate binding protein n=1 Tax=Dankookia rubra TaxID=1442381 RepID=A0A4R5Q5D7_9PROT|nr:hypothetical protein E2C06_34320 [Dankookia rubra]